MPFKSAYRKNVWKFVTRKESPELREAICNNCGKQFKIKKPNKKQHKDGVEGLITIEYFSCKHCKKKYVSNIYNDKLKQNIKETKQLLQKYQNEKDVQKKEELYSEYQKMKQDNMRLGKHLKFFFSKYVEEA